MQARARHATHRLIHLGDDVQAVAKTATGQVTLFPVYLSSFYTYITLLEVRNCPPLLHAHKDGLLMFVEFILSGLCRGKPCKTASIR